MQKHIPAILFTALATIAVTTACASPESRQQRLEEKMTERFTQADANGDGYLTPEEAESGMPFVSRHFEEIDEEKRGSVTLDDIRAYAAERAASR